MQENEKEDSFWGFSKISKRYTHTHAEMKLRFEQFFEACGMRKNNEIIRNRRRVRVRGGVRSRDRNLNPFFRLH